MLKSKKIAAGLLYTLYIFGLLCAVWPTGAWQSRKPADRPASTLNAIHTIHAADPENTQTNPLYSTSTGIANIQAYFIAVGSELQTPLSDTSMPFWSDDCLYIPVSIFNERSCRTLGISISSSTSQVILYSQGRSLIYERDDPLCHDSEGQTHSPGLRARNGNLFVPAYQVAAYFHFLYELTPVQGNIAPAFQGYLIWLHQPGSKLDVQEFARAATFNMQMIWQEYLQGKRQEPETERPMIGESAGVTLPSRDAEDTPEENQNPNANTGIHTDASPAADDVHDPDPVIPDGENTQNSSPDKNHESNRNDTETESEHSENENHDGISEDEPEPEPPGIKTKILYLCFQADKNTGELLDTLEEAGESAAFFCSIDVLSRQDDTARRLLLSGCSIGLIADGESELPIREQIRLGNQLLYQATSMKTRLVYIRNGSEAQLLDAYEAGYACLSPDVYWDSYLLRGASDADVLLQSLSGNEEDRENPVIWMGETGDIQRAEALLSAAQRVGHTLSAFRENVC